LRAAKVWRETASGAKADRVRLRRALAQLDKGDVLLVTRLDRLARSTRDLLNTLASIADKGAGFCSLGDTWADTTTPQGRTHLKATSRFSVLRWVNQFTGAYAQRARKLTQHSNTCRYGSPFN
jgi:DNA invertase Pin-like site-specific DNA recombinase